MSAERQYAHEEAIAWTTAMHKLTDALSHQRSYNVNDIPRPIFNDVEEAFTDWALAYVRHIGARS